MAAAALNKIERAHQMYRDGRHEEALGFYTDALGMAKTKAQKIALHSNRAACYLKLHDFKKVYRLPPTVANNKQLDSVLGHVLWTSKCWSKISKGDDRFQFCKSQTLVKLISALLIATAINLADIYLYPHDVLLAAEECTLVLELDHKHTGALMLRAQTLVTLGEYQSALFDVNRLLELNPSAEVYQNLQARLKTQLSLAPIPECEEESLVAELEDDIDKEVEDQEEEEEEEEEEDGRGEEMEEIKEKEKPVVACAGEDQKTEDRNDTPKPETSTPQSKDSPEIQSKGWEAIPKPKGHSNLDYSRWDQVEDDSSEEDDDEDDDSQLQYRFRVRTVGVRSVK